MGESQGKGTRFRGEHSGKRLGHRKILKEMHRDGNRCKVGVGNSLIRVRVIIGDADDNEDMSQCANRVNDKT